MVEPCMDPWQQLAADPASVSLSSMGLPFNRCSGGHTGAGFLQPSVQKLWPRLRCEQLPSAPSP